MPNEKPAEATEAKLVLASVEDGAEDLEARPDGGCQKTLSSTSPASSPAATLTVSGNAKVHSVARRSGSASAFLGVVRPGGPGVTG